VLSSEGILGLRYEKEVLVPFSEYLPLAGLDPMHGRSGGPRTFSAGRRNQPPLETRLGLAGVLVCNEAMLPEIAAARVRAGAELLVSPSNDDWIAGAAFAEHMFAVVSLRAIEQRRYLVRASTSGPSGIVDPWGRVRARSKPGSRGVLTGRIVPRSQMSGYARLGDAFAFGCTAWSIIALGFALRARRATGSLR